LSSTIFFPSVYSFSYSSSSPAKSCSVLLPMFFLFSSQIIFLFSKLSSPSTVLLRIYVFQIIFLPSSSLKLQIVFLFLCSSDLRFLDRLSSSFVFFISGSSSSGFYRSTSIELESKKLKFHVDKLFHLNS